MLVGETVSPVQVFNETRKKLPSSRGIKQSFVIKSLALQTQIMTRNVLAKLFVEKFMVPQPHAYHYVFKELHECLIPNGIVEEAGTIKPQRGSRILQSSGIPYYRLTKLGVLLAMSVDDLTFEERKELLKSYLITTKILNASEIAFCDQLSVHLQKYPEATLEIVKKGAREFINGKIKNPLEIIQDNEQIINKDYQQNFSYNFEAYFSGTH